jgi:GntR family transcriptional regulator, transcriptional repressor for pyruvate dehydrogenase complex
VGGAVIHSPKAKTAAYMLGMVLQARDVPLADLAAALLEFEPACAAKAAESADQVSKLVPVLVGLNDELESKLGDGPAFTSLAHRFHDAVVQGCGNATMALVAGALEQLWSTHESNWAEAVIARREYPKVVAREAQKGVFRTHVRITEAIEAGDPERTRRLVARHLHESQRYVLAGGRRQLITVEGLAKAPW